MNLVITSLEVRIEDLGLDEFFEKLHKQKKILLLKEVILWQEDWS